MRTPFQIPENILMGSATASLQIEGGDRNNSWYEWAEAGHIADGSKTSPATDHWNMVKEDIALMKKMNHQVYRMSIEWSRIEPSQNKFNAKAMRHYRDEITQLIAAGIKPMVTLHHFSNPLWFEHSGGWLRDDAPEIFLNYAGHVAGALGDLVSDWVTINEPNVYLTKGYVYGEWPPAHRDLGEFFRGAENMIEAHILAYQSIHRIRETMGRGDSMVGSAHHVRVFDPQTLNPLDRIVAAAYEHLFQGIFLTSMTTGRSPFPLKKRGKKIIGSVSDFIGLNYYTRDMVRFTLDRKANFGKLSVKSGAPVNDLGWEIYPEGFYRLLKKFYFRFKKPVYVTENGTCDRNDDFRAQFICDHLQQLSRAAAEGVDIRAYCHWTLVDNFEWIEGFSARFGLAALDMKTMKRKIRRSGELYGKICKAKALSPEMIAKYLKE